jgi:alkylation response protein AidB-like acyl-CoA dehydrogenase
MSEQYHPNSDQVSFAESVGKSLRSLLPLNRLHQSNEETAQTWAALHELGVLGISVSEERGGSGLGATEEALIVIELGRRAVAPSVLSTIGATHVRAAAKYVRDTAKQRVAACYRHGTKIVCIDDSHAALLLVRSESGAELCERPKQARVLDEKLWSSRVLELGPELTEPLAKTSADEALRLRLLDAAVLAGLASAALEMAVAYAKLREQFGRTIGSYQAIKHHCANMALAARSAIDQVSFAAVAVDAERDDAVLQVENAFYVAGAAALENCSKNIQVHGGIGFSDEADPHLLLKRARLFVAIAGGLEAALIRIAELPSAEAVRVRT